MIFCMTVAEPDPDADAALEDCIARIAGGDKDALADLYNRTRPAVYGFALSIVKNAHDAEDILHDACLQVWNAAGGYRRQGKPMAWVLTITRNLAISRLREHGRTEPLVQEDWQDRLADNPAVTHEDRMMLEAVLSALSDEERQIVTLHALTGLRHREIAALLGLPLPTVLSKYSRALKKLQLASLSLAALLLAGLLNLGRSETAGGRVSTWIDLWTSSQTEKPIDRLTDTERSMIAIHNGGLLGEGAGQSAMRVEMIHPESDYAYAFFVEEYGIILAGILLMLYLWIFFRAREIFVRCGTAFPGLLVLGLALMITCQALLHVMVTVNLMPETGQTLPLISRGGSSVLFTVIALGMILSVSRQNDEHSHDTPRSESIYEK